MLFAVLVGCSDRPAIGSLYQVAFVSEVVNDLINELGFFQMGRDYLSAGMKST